MASWKKRAAASNSDQPPVKKSRPGLGKVDLLVPERPKLSGSILVCGQNDVGQLGLGEDVSEKTRPGVVSDLKNVVDVRAGGMHTLCLTASGEVWSFGCNDEGALGRDTSEEGSEYTPGKVNLPSPCVKISAGDSHSACLLEDGQIYAWGSFRDSHGNMGLTLDGNMRIPVALLKGLKGADIASGADHLVILSTSGQIYTVGCGEQGQLGRVSSRSASGESRRGKVELLKPEIVSTRKTKFIDAIWTTNFSTFYRDHGTKQIYAFGLNNYNQLALPKRTRKMTLVFTPNLTEMRNVKTISGGQHHTLVVSEDSQCYAIGRKDYGRLGIGEVPEDVTELMLVKDLPAVTDVGCGDSQSFALTSEEKVFAWGMGNNHQLGLGSDQDVDKPTELTGAQVKDKRVLRVDSGGQHSVFLVTEPGAQKKGSDIPVEKRNGAGDGVEPGKKAPKAAKKASKK
ncbi:regulator of chromosome condensation [Phlebotomus argentipes]|uniref:regulator of chromosome condensation n=1 Tax=Phlebotomus argentipes TaxID=94469 RepID=UPI0028931B2B|nr:regulator of chromosome condensation [Phlebotomus argentipes]